eukprot:scaffold437_cov159-Amphora_coffeaeformis.AAC.11
MNVVSKVQPHTLAYRSSRFQSRRLVAFLRLERSDKVIFFVDRLRISQELSFNEIEGGASFGGLWDS